MRVLVISDLHVGSRYAIMPQHWKGFTAMKHQRFLLRKWKEMIRKVGHVDAVVVNGDAVDGKQKGSQGKGLWTSDVDEQIDAAVDLVRMIDFDRIHVTYGSIYHTEENLNADRVFARRIGATSHGDEIHGKMENGVVHFSHQITVSSSAWQYRTTPLAKELVAAVLNDDVFPKYRVIVRSHAHYFCYAGFSKNFAIVTPCWQLRTPYMIRKGLALVPKLGYVLLIDEKDGISFVADTFDAPVREVNKL